STTCLYYAVKNGNVDLVELLLKNGAKVDSIDFEGCSLLHLAVACQKREFCKNFARILQMLLEKGAKSTTNDRKSLTPLCKAVVYGCLPSVVNILEYASANDKIFHQDNCTSLNLATFQNRSDIVLALIENDFKLDNLNAKLQTPL
ncbi:hypothetical protein HELRODRAFT_143654, partial [Helobdella robusta]|uniref:Uncharacterized protein n=1 Tax=Helobdella robusta TaxID=6412 RepID=T1EJB5_HELRO